MFNEPTNRIVVPSDRVNVTPRFGREQGTVRSVADSSFPVVPGYTVLRVLGRGGMGTVYEAVQRDGDRHVALKVLSGPTPDDDAISRFAIERQAISRLDHPNVARVYYAGTTAAGSTYLSMEIVRGLPLTEHCQKNQLSIPDRLRLIIEVCRAVQHAHQKGVIHRDLKPSNVLVADVDGQSVPKVIDFGLAKLFDESDQTWTRTLPGMIAGTPLYMAPEQTEFGGNGVDTRADIYSLGVMLFELLTDRTPVSSEEVRNLDVSTVLRLIRERACRRPSELSGRRLRGQITNDLDWITLKCLEKEPERRYQTAEQLANDLERLLSDQPVMARPPSRWYAVRKFVKRNRTVVASAVACLAMLIVAIVGTTIGLVKAEKHRAIAESRHVEAERAREMEAEAKRLAEKRATEAGQLTGLLTEVLRDLDPTDHKHGTAPVREVLANRLIRIQRELATYTGGDPEVLGRLRLVLGETLFGLGKTHEAMESLQAARTLLRESLGEDAPPTVMCVQQLSLCYSALNRLKEALQLMEEVHAVRHRSLGPEHPDTLFAQCLVASAERRVGNYARAEKLYDSALPKLTTKIGPDAADTLCARCELASVYQGQYRLNKAIELLEDVLACYRRTVGSNHISTLVTLNNLGAAYQIAERLDRAEECFAQALAGNRDHFGDAHANSLLGAQNLAGVLNLQGKYQQAFEVAGSARDIARMTLGESHPTSLRLRRTVAVSRYYLLHDAEALREFDRLYDRFWAEFGPMNLETTRLVEFLKEVVQFKDGLDAGRQVLIDHRERLRSAGHRGNGVTLHFLSLITDLSRHWSDVESMWDEEESDWLQQQSPQIRFTDFIAKRATFEVLEGQYTSAEPKLLRLVEAREQRGENPWLIANARSLLGASYLGQGRLDEAECLLLESWDCLLANKSSIPDFVRQRRLREAADRVARLFVARGRFAEVEELRRKHPDYAPVASPTPRVVISHP